jgi:hypothetical protein
MKHGSPLLRLRRGESAVNCSRRHGLLAAEDVAVGRVVDDDGVALGERAGEQAAGDGVLHLPLHHAPQGRASPLRTCRVVGPDTTIEAAIGRGVVSRRV